jgi:hypothetical protein
VLHDLLEVPDVGRADVQQRVGLAGDRRRPGDLRVLAERGGDVGR